MATNFPSFMNIINPVSKELKILQLSKPEENDTHPFVLQLGSQRRSGDAGNL